MEVDDLLEDVTIVKEIESVNEPITKILILEQDFEKAFKKELEILFAGKYAELEAEAKELIKPIGSQQKGVIARYIVRKAKFLGGFSSGIGSKLSQLLLPPPTL